MGRGLQEVKDPEGKTYLDFLSAYSAVNQGHRHPKILAAAREQLDRVHPHESRLPQRPHRGPSSRSSAKITGFDMALPMNTGVEAVETAIKAARRWGAEVKGVRNGEQEIVCAEGNFHGRTLAAISMSSDPDSLVNYGPYLPGFRKVPYGDAAAVEAAITPRTVAVLVEPIQGEAGIVVPPEGYLKAVREICTRRRRPLHRRRDPDGLLPDRAPLRLATRRRAARHHVPRQGPGRGHHADVGDSRGPRGDGRLHAGHARAPPSAAIPSPPPSA